MNIGYKIGDKIREYRKNLKMSQLDLAVEMEVNQSTLWSWENGKTFPTIQNLVKLADYFGLKLWAFFKELDL